MPDSDETVARALHLLKVAEMTIVAQEAIIMELRDTLRKIAHSYDERIDQICSLDSEVVRLRSRLLMHEVLVSQS